MKEKIVLFLLVTLSFFTASAQFTPQSMGGAPNMVTYVKGALRGDSGLVVISFADTSIANRGPNIKKTDGILIKVGDTIFMRNVSISKWVRFIDEATTIYYINQYIDNSVTSLTNYIDSSVSNVYEYVDNSIALNNYYNQVDSTTRKINGSIIWNHDFNFDASIINYLILGRPFQTAALNFDIDGSDSVDRYTAIIGDTLNNLIIRNGERIDSIAAIPDVDAASEILLKMYLIPAYSTQPVEIDGTPIYNSAVYAENNPLTEWAHTTNIAAIDFNSTSIPSTGFKAINITAIPTGRYIDFTDTTTHLPTEYDYVSFELRLNSSFNNNTRPVLSFYNGNTLVTPTPVTILTGNYGFDRTLTGAYMKVIVPIPAFLFNSGASFNTLRLAFSGSNNNGARIDNVTLHKDATTVVNNSQVVNSFNGQDGHVLYVRSSTYSIDSAFMVNYVNGVRSDSIGVIRDTLSPGLNTYLTLFPHKFVVNAYDRVDSIWRTAGQDSIKFSIGGRLRSIKDSAGAAATTPNLQQVTDVGKITTNWISVANTLRIWSGAFNNAVDIGIGFEALNSNTAPLGATATGYQALKANTSGTYNSGYGYQSLLNNILYSFNAGFGALSLSNFVGGFLGSPTVNGGNTALGAWAMRGTAGLFTGHSNTGAGVQVLDKLTTGYSNSGLGYWTLLNNTTGYENTAFGTTAMRQNISGALNSAFGRYSLWANTAGNYNTAFGNRSLYNVLGDGNIGLGNQAGENETGSNKLYVDNNNTATPMIWADLALDSLRINGVFGVSRLATGLTAPVITGTKKMVITDANGTLSFEDIPSSGGAVVTAFSGLTKVGDSIRLGGTLSANTTIAGNNKSLTINNYNLLDLSTNSLSYASGVVYNISLDNDYSDIYATTNSGAYGGSGHGFLYNNQIEQYSGHDDYNSGLEFKANMDKNDGSGNGRRRTLFMSDSIFTYRKTTTGTSTDTTFNMPLRVNGVKADVYGNITISTSGASTTASRGLNVLGNDVRWGGTLDSNVSVIGGVYNFAMTSSANDAFTVTGAANAIVGSGSVGVTGLGTAYGVIGVTTNGVAGVVAGGIFNTSSAIDRVLMMQKTTSVTASDGVGEAIDFQIQTYGGVAGSYSSGRIISLWETANTVTRRSKFYITGMNTGGTEQNLLTLNGNGVGAFLKGADVASAGTITATGNSFHVTGTTTITSVSGTFIEAGSVVTIIFDGALTFTDGSNLKLAGNFSTTADATITLQYDGTNWYEITRSTN